MIRRLKLLYDGFFPTPSEYERQVRTSYAVLVIIAAMTLYAACAAVLLDAWHSFAIACAAFVGHSVSALLHHRQRHTEARIVMLVVADLGLFAGSFLLHPASNLSLILLAFVGLPFVVFSWRENRVLVASLSALPLVLWNILIFTDYGGLSFTETDAEVARVLGYWHSIILFFFIAAEFGYFDYVTHTYYKALRKSLAAEEKAGRVKTVFLSSMNHEVRTPLNAIIGSAELLRAHPNATPDMLRMADDIDRAGQDILAMTEKSLAYTNLISGPIDVTLRPEDPMRMILAELNHHRGLIRSKGVKVETRRMCTDQVMADADLMSKVLAQLIDNAIKYVPEKGTVRLVVDKGADDRLRISVKDDGPGIPMDRCKQVFQPFERLEQSLGTRSGCGIGLAIAKACVDAMGGEIGVTPRTDGGAHIWVELPGADPQPTRAAAANAPAKPVLRALTRPART